MALFTKKQPDLISERARALNAQIAALESKIKRLDGQLQHRQSQPRLRSTAVPHGTTVTHAYSARRPEAQSPVVEHDPVFEDIGKEVLDGHSETAATPDHFNEKGVRKYDFPGLLRRTRDYFQSPKATNPRLVAYLAAGGVQGLRPMRYERRVARNRFLLFTTGLFLSLLGILWWYYRNR